jgi:hypothetical protein
VLRAIAVAAEESEGDGASGRKRRRKRRGAAKPAEAVNEPLAFITFIANHKLGSEVEGEVEMFTSHGAFVMAEGARCYIPIVALGDPPPRAARDVLNRSEVRRFVVQALDPQRRGIELALPEFARVAGAPRPETVEAEIAGLPAASGGVGHGRPKGLAKKAAVAKKAPAVPGASAAKKAPVAKKAPAVAKKAPAKEAKPAVKKAAVKRAVKKDAGKKEAMEKTPAKNAAKKAPPKQGARRKAPPAKSAAPPAKSAAPPKKATAKRAPVARRNPARTGSSRAAPKAKG